MEVEVSGYIKNMSDQSIDSMDGKNSWQTWESRQMGKISSKRFVGGRGKW